MECQKCQDRGFTELDRGGITCQFCDCEAGEKFRAKTLTEMGFVEPVQESVRLEDPFPLPKKRKAANVRKKKRANSNREGT